MKLTLTVNDEDENNLLYGAAFFDEEDNHICDLFEPEFDKTTAIAFANSFLVKLMDKFNDEWFYETEDEVDGTFVPDMTLVTYYDNEKKPILQGLVEGGIKETTRKVRQSLEQAKEFFGEDVGFSVVTQDTFDTALAESGETIVHFFEHHEEVKAAKRKALIQLEETVEEAELPETTIGAEIEKE